MKRVKLVVKRQDPDRYAMLGDDCRLVDADTGEEIEPVRDISLHFGLDQVVTATAEIMLCGVDVVEPHHPLFAPPEAASGDA